AGQRDLVSVVAKLEARTLGRISDITNALGAVLRETDLDHLGQAILGDFNAIVVVAINQHHSVLRDDVEQPLKAQFDVVDVVENVGVIELDVVHDHELGQVMNEL